MMTPAAEATRKDATAAVDNFFEALKRKSPDSPRIQEVRDLLDRGLACDDAEWWTGTINKMRHNGGFIAQEIRTKFA